MTGKVQKLLVVLKSGAEALYRERLRGIYLYLNNAQTHFGSGHVW